MDKNRESKPLLTEDDFKPENIKANITIRMSSALLDAYRAEAKRLGIGYQTLMQINLQKALDNKIEKRIEDLELESKLVKRALLAGKMQRRRAAVSANRVMRKVPKKKAV